MKIVADTHTHTLVSGHAYSTITENMLHASKIGLRFLACTDHTTLMPGAPHEFYFLNLPILPEEMFGVHLLRGCEANIVDAQGKLDLPDRILERLDWVIASLHPPVYQPSDRKAHTETWLNLAKNPLVDVIGHCGDERYRFDYEIGIQAFAENGKIVEINSHSFTGRPKSDKNCREIALLCKKYSVPIVVSSDAHFYTQIGDFTDALKMLEEIDFPEELILNADYGRFCSLINQKTQRKF